MARPGERFEPRQPMSRSFGPGDIIVLGAVAALLYLGVRLAMGVPAAVSRPVISLVPRYLPWYAALSLGRMAAAYILSLVFSLVYGRAAAYNRRTEQALMPLLDVLQSVPILSFLPVVLLGFSAFLPQGVANELASIVLIFTSQVWNMTFAWYQSLTTVPKELREVSQVFQFSSWRRFRTLELPFGTISLVWNSIMSWAGGWFFLMAAEAFTVGERDFRLPGLGSYLQEAANQGDLAAIGLGLVTLVLLIVALDQILWRPLLAWADRFKLETVETAHPPTSWFYHLLRTSGLIRWFGRSVQQPLVALLERRSAARRSAGKGDTGRAGRWRAWLTYFVYLVIAGGALYGLYLALGLLVAVPVSQWAEIGVGLGATTMRVAAALVMALLWTVPVGVAIGTNPRLASVLQPVVQIAASVPATALFPVLLVVLLQLPGGLNVAAVLLMLLGTQWYLLFNVIAGASAIPQDLEHTTTLLQLSGWTRWRTLVLPALFPYVVTGAVTAVGGAWNASVVGEAVQFGGETLSTVGIGAIIHTSTAVGDYPLLLAATLSMILTVILFNRLLWRRLYQQAEERYRME